MQDEQAVARLKQGDLQSLEPLVARYYLPAVRAAYLILQDKGQAEDVVKRRFSISPARSTNMTCGARSAPGSCAAWSTRPST